MYEEIKKPIWPLFIAIPFALYASYINYVSYTAESYGGWGAAMLLPYFNFPWFYLLAELRILPLPNNGNRYLFYVLPWINAYIIYRFLSWLHRLVIMSD